MIERPSNSRLWAAFFWSAVSVLTFFAAELYASRLFYGLKFPWSAHRLAGVVAWKMGYPLYSVDSGPILTTIYGPISALAYLPVVYCRQPLTAILAGVLLSNLYYFGPAFWLILSHRSEGSYDAAWRYLLCLLFILFSSWDAALRYCAWSVHADAPALCLGASACIFLCLSEASEGWAFALSALCGSLAFWTKQNMLPLPVVLVGYVGWTRGLQSGVRYAVCFLAAMMAVSIVMLSAFGAEAVTFNMIRMASRRPWKEAAVLPALIGAAGYMAAHAAFPILAIAWSWWRNRRHSAGDLFSSPRGVLSLFVAAALIPTSLVAWVTVGADINSFCFPTYFLSLSALMCLLNSGALGQNLRAPRKTCLALCCLLLAVQARSLSHLGRRFRQLRYLPETLAYQYELKHPGEIYFPRNTLAVLLASHRATHFDYALYDRRLAGWPVSPAHFREFLPKNMVRMALPDDEYYEYPPIESVVGPYLPGFRKRVQVKELPGWVVLEEKAG